MVYRRFMTVRISENGPEWKKGLLPFAKITILQKSKFFLIPLFHADLAL